MRDTDSRPPLRELPARFSLPLIGDTLAFVRDPAGFLQKRARELGPVFRIDVFGAPTACFVGPEAFALVLDDKNVARAGANPPHVEELFNPEAVPFLDGEKQRRRKRLLMRAFTPDALEEYLPTIEQVIDRYSNRWAGLGRFAWVPELNAMGFAIAGSLFIGADPVDFADGDATRTVGDVVGSLDAPARRLEPHVAACEIAHGGGADEPGADPVRGALEELRAVLPAWQRRPAVTEDAAVDGGAHVAEDVWLHGAAP